MPRAYQRNRFLTNEEMAALVERFDGEVPGRMKDLVTLPGVGRKTANVVLGNAFGVPGITVDTHFGRLVRRFGMTELRPGQYVLVRFGPGSKGMMAAEIQPENGAPGLSSH